MPRVLTRGRGIRGVFFYTCGAAAHTNEIVEIEDATKRPKSFMRVYYRSAVNGLVGRIRDSCLKGHGFDSRIRQSTFFVPLLICLRKVDNYEA